MKTVWASLFIAGLAYADPPIDDGVVHRAVPVGMASIEATRARLGTFEAPVRDTLSAHLDDAEAAGELVSAFGRAFGFGADAVYCVHTMGLTRGPTTVRCANATGEAVELDTAWVEFTERRYAAQGSMTTPMVEQLDPATPEARYAATVWLRQPAAEPREFLPRDAETFALLEARRERRRATVADACRALGERCEIVELENIHAPFFEISATADALNALAFHPLVGAIEPTSNVEPQPGVGDRYLQSDYFDAVQAMNPPWDGDGVKVAIVEGPRIEPLSLPAFAGIHDPATDLYCSASVAGFHAGIVGSVIAADSSFGTNATRILDGAAPKVELLVANLGASVNGMPTRNCKSSAADPTCDPTCNFSASITGAVNWTRGRLVDVINSSNEGTDPAIAYRTTDRFFDWVANNHPWPVVVPITGQMPNTTVSTYGCYNCIVTGGSNSQDTKSRLDDTSFGDEDFENRPNQLEVPHVVAPAVDIRSLDKDTWTLGQGTSLAAPQVSGLAAAVIGEHPDLKSYPEAIRALIMATATLDVDGVALDLNDAIDDRDGAGAINAFLAAYLLTTGVKNTWGADHLRGLNFGLMNSADFSGGYYNKVIIFTAPSTPHRFQATLTWNVVSTCSDADGDTSSSGSCPALSEPLAIGQYGIEVHEGFGNIVAQSTPPAVAHNYAHVRLDSLVPGQTYVMFIKRPWVNPTPPGLQYFGLAWHAYTPFFE